MFRHALVFSLLTLLAGCAGLTSRESVEGQGDAKLWQAHKAQVAALERYGVRVTARQSLSIPPNAFNRRYLATKGERFGHIFACQ